MRALMRSHPRLVAVFAHLGAPDYADFLDLVEHSERAFVDTTMAFTGFFEAMAPFPADRLPQLASLREKVLLGSDFPNIPYPYAHQLESLARLELGEDWLRAVCWDNGVRLFGPGG
jgi:predicted TIM-barrel fold metal-dependent hydrolase